MLVLRLMIISVFNEAAAVLKGKAAFFAGERRELILMCVKVAVKVERLSTVEHLSTLLAHQTALFWLSSQIGILLSVKLLVISNHIPNAVDFSHKLLGRVPVDALAIRGRPLLLWNLLCTSVIIDMWIMLQLFRTLCNIAEDWKKKKTQGK